MAQPEFHRPECFDGSTTDEIHERMMASLPDDIDDMPAGFPYDFTRPAAEEKSEFINYHLIRAVMLAFPQYAWDDWLDLHGAQVHVTRHAEQYATGNITITGVAGSVIAAGTVFCVPAVDDNPAIEFATNEDCTIADDGTVTVAVTAVESGIGSNVAAHTVCIMAKSDKNITGIDNAEPISGGTVREEDGDYFDRIFAEYDNSKTYLGNDSDFVRWAKEAGAGDCIVVAAFDGPGTVKLVLVDGNGQPANAKLINDVYKGKTYQFTLTKPVPAKGQLAGLYRAPDVSPSEWKVYSFESNTATDPIETVAMVEGTGGTALGTLSFKPTSPLNGLQSTAYGYNRWAQSAMRQWLNSEEANGKWWTPQHNFDRTPDQLKEKHGFLTGFDEEFTKRLKATKVSTWKNTLTDNGDTDGIEVTYDKVFLPSLEAMSINPQKAGEDDVWEYWKRASGMAEKMQQYKTYPQIRTFAIENHTSPQSVRLRSATRGYSYDAWYVYSGGTVHYYSASWASRCAPACWLC